MKTPAVPRMLDGLHKATNRVTSVQQRINLEKYKFALFKSTHVYV